MPRHSRALATPSAASAVAPETLIPFRDLGPWLNGNNKPLRNTIRPRVRRMIREGRFPAPVILSGGSQRTARIAWRLSDLMAYDRNRPVRTYPTTNPKPSRAA